ncbi:WD domain, G-beta repeat containing protein [Drechmeria coniospora]|uniref:WD domain, G-beta repeat containing protein n=1 Tax=Drechmeria coniospora TaxID=98403 RepID=A0A151GM42_DRECN|nr:WD domain, G-beta repeat containing protein [Drechmeria coniospora]KYK58170.1 WD domain, G-beta repeat containing protein [Drechmeria coniospora]
MRKLLGGRTAADTSTDISSASPTTPVPVAYRPSKSQNAVYAAGVPISCFDVASDKRAAVLGGPHILKTMVLDGAGYASFSFTEGLDVRAAILTRQSTNPRASVVADQLNIRDVKWHGSSTIFTACASGKIFAYDLARIGAGAGSEPLECIQIQEDSRQVNTLDVNPHLKSWVLSGSQDGTARIFDASAPLQNRSGVLTFRQRFAPLRCIDSVRQVKWSPRVGHEMACCTESGVVLKWDVRQPVKPLLRINAHEKACAAIAWHPDGAHLMSAGWDTKLHVWDLGSSADKRQKPKWTISTPAPVSAIAWRPGLWSATTQSRRLAEVAVTYDETSNRRYGTSAVHIWDLARPTMPYKEIQRFDSSPTALAWQDQDVLWTVGQDGLFNQCDVAFAPKVIDRQSTSAMAFSPRGDVVMFLDERPQSQRPRPSSTHEPEVHRQTYTSIPNTPAFGVSRSESEEEVIGTFLGPRRRRAHRRRLSGRDGGGRMSTTPPSGGSSFPDNPKQVLNLEQSINVTGIFKTQQTMASGPIPSAKSVHVYQYLSSEYLETLAKNLPEVQDGATLVDRVGSIMERFAKAAENANQYRLAQTWRILAYVMRLLLERRAQYHLDLRVNRFQKLPGEDLKGSARLKPPDSNDGNGEETPRRPSTQRGSIDSRFLSRSLLTEEIESTSNAATPLARPTDPDVVDDHTYQYGKKLAPIVEPESLRLGPAVHDSFRESTSPEVGEGVATSTSMPGHEESSTEGYDFYDIAAPVQAIDVPAPKNDAKGPRYEAHAAGQDSVETLSQMFSISDGTKRSIARSSSSGDVFAKPHLVRQASGTEKSSVTSSVELGGPDDVSPTASRTGTEKRTESPDEVFLISQTTLGTDESFPSQTTYSGSYGQKSPGDPSERRSSMANVEVESAPSPSEPSSSPKHDTRRYVIESDYLPWEDDPPYPYTSPYPAASADGAHSAGPPSPLDPYRLLTSALAFESKSSALNASAMILLLRPLVPESVIDGYQARAILRQHHACLMRMSLFVEAALLRNLCVKGWPAGLPDWGDNYTVVFAVAQQGVKVGFFCSACRKPREVDPSAGANAVWTCERCRSVMAPCAVCGHRNPERADGIPLEVSEGSAAVASLSKWWYCPGCAHGGHASCLQTWHAPVTGSAPADASSKYSDGCCPLDGCGHACLPGKYRGETTTQRSDETARAAAAAAESARMAAELHHQRSTSGNGSRKTSPHQSSALSERGNLAVVSDGHDVPPSHAVSAARETLNAGGGGGILSSSPSRQPGAGAMSGDRERRKSVKFARTGR